MKRKFEEIMDKVSENNNLMMKYAAEFRSEIDKNYVSRRWIHLISFCIWLVGQISSWYPALYCQ